MRFSLDVMRSRKGDCLMLHYGTKSQPRLVMIDGGPASVYKPHLRPRIMQIRDARGLDDQTPLPVEVLMVSHVDDDHIKGVLDLTKELRRQKTDQEPPLVRVRSLWHNSFDDLLKTTPAELKAAAKSAEAALANPVGLPHGEDLDVAKVLASIPQGRVLRDDASLLAAGTSDWKVNDRFKGKLILASKGAKPVTLDGGLKFTVIGPLQAELEALQEEHDKYLRSLKGKKKKSAESALAAFVDTSVANLSSLVLLAEAGGKRVLLTGDARGDKILEGLELLGLLKPGGKSTIHVDVFKVPHHGSANNADVSLFRRVTADHYVFSGDGEHGNPERETIEMLFEARGKSPFTMHFTYPLDEIDVERKLDWEKEQARQRKAKAKKVRPDWSPRKHSLQALIADHGLAAGQRVATITKDKQPHVIDLLDPLGV